MNSLREVSMAEKHRQQVSVAWRVGLFVGLLAVAAVVLIIIFNQQSAQAVNNFQECKEAGGMVQETYPEQCRIGDKSFVNEAQSAQNTGEAYVGLLEKDALDKASEIGKIARVVKRDSEDLPVTMDFSPGRLNLYVQGGKVYMVQVEGEE